MCIRDSLDTVRCAGAFDGPAGIVCSLEAARMLRESGEPLESGLEVVATIMEDGGRYPGTTGSRFMAGIYGEEDLTRLKDDDGLPLIEAMKAYGLSGSIEGVRRRPEEAKAFLELHMEQASKLESTHTDIGVVRTICGNAWFRVTAVSYTHLDVYKRQLPVCASFDPSRCHADRDAIAAGRLLLQRHRRLLVEGTMTEGGQRNV